MTGCGPGQDEGPGFVEIKTSFAVRDKDSYSFGETVVRPGPDGRIDTVIQAEPGKSGIYLQRAGQKYSLCVAAVSKNRIVSIALSDNGGAISCKVKT